MLRRILCALAGHRGAYRKVPVEAPCPRCGEPFETAATTPPPLIAYRFLCAGLVLSYRVVRDAWRWLHRRER